MTETVIRVLDYPDYWYVWCPVRGFETILKNGMWQFDGNVLAPTFSPSILQRHPTADQHGTPDWETPATWKAVNHFFVRSGLIEYLPDCSHKFAGQTHQLLVFPPDFIEAAAANLPFPRLLEEIGVAERFYE